MVRFLKLLCKIIAAIVIIIAAGCIVAYTAYVYGYFFTAGLVMLVLLLGAI